MLSRLLISLIAVCLITVHSEDPKSGNDAGRNVDLRPEINALSKRLDGAQSAFQASESTLRKEIETISSDSKGRLSNLETTTNTFETRLSGIDTSLLNQEKTISEKLDAFGQKLKNLETVAVGSEALVKEIDLTKYVELKDINDIKKEFNSLKSSVNDINNNNKELKNEMSQLSQISELNEIKKQLSELNELKSLNEKNLKLEKEISLLKKSINSLSNELSNTKEKHTNKVSSDGKIDKKLNELGKQLEKVNTNIERHNSDFDDVRQDVTDLEKQVHLIREQTIGAMIERGLETCEILLKQAMQFAKEKGLILMDLSQKYGKIMLEKGKELGAKGGVILKEKFEIIVNEIKNYDYSWLTDKENWKLIGNYLKNMGYVANKWTREQIIPAIKKQSSETINNIQTFCVNFYQNRKDYQLYQQVSKILLPLLKKIDETVLPSKYYSLTLDIIMTLLVFFGILLSWSIFWLFCACLCPKIPKVEDNENINININRNRNKNRNRNRNANNNNNNNNNNNQANGVEVGTAANNNKDAPVQQKRSRKRHGKK